MRVCMITSSYPRHAGDGAGSFVGSLARTLAAQGHGVGVLAPYDAAIPREERPARPQRRAESLAPAEETLRCAQGDNSACHAERERSISK